MESEQRDAWSKLISRHLHRSEQRCLLIESIPVEGDEGGRDEERVTSDWTTVVRRFGEGEVTCVRVGVHGQEGRWAAGRQGVL